MVKWCERFFAAQTFVELNYNVGKLSKKIDFKCSHHEKYGAWSNGNNAGDCGDYFTMYMYIKT